MFTFDFYKEFKYTMFILVLFATISYSRETTTPFPSHYRIPEVGTNVRLGTIIKVKKARKPKNQFIISEVCQIAVETKKDPVASYVEMSNSYFENTVKAFGRTQRIDASFSNYLQDIETATYNYKGGVKHFIEDGIILDGLKQLSLKNLKAIQFELQGNDTVYLAITNSIIKYDTAAITIKKSHALSNDLKGEYLKLFGGQINTLLANQDSTTLSFNHTASAFTIKPLPQKYIDLINSLINDHVNKVAVYPDNDGDSCGDINSTPQFIGRHSNIPKGFVYNQNDCNDNDSTLHNQTTWYKDQDDDSYGNPYDYQIGGCADLDSSYVLNKLDCDDNNPSLHPKTKWYSDKDSDGFGDKNNTIEGCLDPRFSNPNAKYIHSLKSLGDDCNDSVVMKRFYLDSDDDGIGEDHNDDSLACDCPDGYSPFNTFNKPYRIILEEEQSGNFLGILQTKSKLDDQNFDYFTENKSLSISGDTLFHNISKDTTLNLILWAEQFGKRIITDTIIVKLGQTKRILPAATNEQLIYLSDNIDINRDLLQKKRQLLFSKYGMKKIDSDSVSFLMDSIEITTFEYNRLMKHRYRKNDFNLPISVNWYDAILYCNKRSQEAGFDTVYTYDSLELSYFKDQTKKLHNLQINYEVNGFRLPTTEEWITASGDISNQNTGDSVCLFANIKDSSYLNEFINSIDSTQFNCYDNFGDERSPVASFLPNNVGLYDMFGNVEEWCSDVKDSTLTDETAYSLGSSYLTGTPILLFSNKLDKNYYSSGFRCLLIVE